MIADEDAVGGVNDPLLPGVKGGALADVESLGVASGRGGGVCARASIADDAPRITIAAAIVRGSNFERSDASTPPRARGGP